MVGPRTVFRLLRALSRDSRGNALWIFAAALFPMLAMIGSAVDISLGYMTQTKLQSACDAGVLATRQVMVGNRLSDEALAEGQRFFAFNFPSGTYGVTDERLTITRSNTDPRRVQGVAKGTLPTAIMRIFGFDTIDISVDCDASRDSGYNDVMMVLDVTGSMNCPPGVPGSCGNTERSGSKISRLRIGAVGLYRSMAAADNARAARFGIVPYAEVVNVARSLSNTDILTNDLYYQWRTVCTATRVWFDWFRFRWVRECVATEEVGGNYPVDIRDTQWARDNAVPDSLTAFREGGSGCIEERPSVGYSQTDYQIRDRITRPDVDRRALGATDTALQFGRYDLNQQGNRFDINGRRIGSNKFSTPCPSEAKRLQSFESENAFRRAVNEATARVTGGTYHDVGMLWGLRFLSSTGFFAADNPERRDGIPVLKHIVFMTDGELLVDNARLAQPNPYDYYSSHGFERMQDRTRGNGSSQEQHLRRFLSACDLAKSMGITVWVVALDVTSQEDIEPCASGPNTFFSSDGSDLEQVFADIGAGIGRLRLEQ